MARSEAFWTWFMNDGYRRLCGRQRTFMAMFRYLDQFETCSIVETGCVRDRDNWNGDGVSTILFDRYAVERDGVRAYSVNIDLAAVELAYSIVSPMTYVHHGDSVEFLQSLVPWPRQVGLLYLDSFDCDLDYPWPSAEHHLKELKAALPMINAQTLVAVDDSPYMGGKGLLVGMYAAQQGAKIEFSDYQIGFTGFSSAPQ